jgi:hypothetical protein
MKPDETSNLEDHDHESSWSFTGSKIDIDGLLTEAAAELGPPAQWDLSDDSKPVVLTDWTKDGRWHDMRRLGSRSPGGPLQLPTFDIAPPLRAGRTRPLIRDSDPLRAVEFENVAWLSDVGGMTLKAIARQRTQTDGDRQRVDARRDRDYGRARLRELGVLPWAAFDEVDLPERWWREPPFWERFVLWWRQTSAIKSLIGSPAEEALSALMVIPVIVSLLKRALEAPVADAPRREARTLVVLALENAKRLEERLRQAARSESGTSRSATEEL